MTASVTAYSIKRQQLILGTLQMLVCCVQCLGLMGSPLVKDGKVFNGAHHQFAHNGELQLVLAFVFPYLALSDSMLQLTGILVTIGSWSNGIAYLVQALTGERCIMFPSSATAPEGWYGTTFVPSLLMFVCAPTILLGLFFILVGLLRTDSKKMKVA